MIKRFLAVAVLAALATPAIADDEPRRRTTNEPETYESPILTLLLLPVNVLVKMASVFGPQGKPQSEPVHGSEGKPSR